MSFFSAENITAGYDKNHVIKGVSFALEKGCLMGILGANGSGKTTLLKAVCGILPHTGEVTLDGRKLENLSPRQISKFCSYIPQRSGIHIDISVMDVVLMGFNPRLGLLEHPNHAMRTAAQNVLAQVGLSGKEKMNYLYLSEGQKQLCILARTLVSNSKLLLLDEPESALDFRFRYRMLDILREWVKQKEISAVMTLHDPSLALNYCDQLLLLSDGKILGTVFPRTDPLDQMEQMLEKVYGAIGLQRCRGRDGRDHLVMLKENDL